MPFPSPLCTQVSIEDLYRGILGVFYRLLDPILGQNFKALKQFKKCKASKPDLIIKNVIRTDTFSKMVYAFDYNRFSLPQRLGPKSGYLSLIFFV